MKKYMYKLANMMCALAILAAPFAGKTCKLIFYEPEKPEGFDDFINKKMK